MLELQIILHFFFLQIVVVDVISDYWKIKKILSMIGLEENQ